MAESLSVKKETLAEGVSVNAGASYEISFVSSAGGGKDPMGELNIVVRDHDGHDPIGGAPYKLSGPHGFSQNGNTGSDGSIHIAKPVPVDTYTLHVMDTDFPVVPKPKGGSPLFVRVPGANHEPPVHTGFGPPPRARDDLPGGKAFLASLPEKSGQVNCAYREPLILEQLKLGNVPDFCRTFATIELHDPKKKHTGRLQVMVDYIAVGNNDDYVRIPLSGLTMQKVADLWGCCIPTQKVVAETYHQATNKLVAHNMDFVAFGSMWQATNWGIQQHDNITQGVYECDSKTKSPPEAANRVHMNFILNHRGKCALKNPHPMTLTSGHRKEVIIHPDDLKVHLAFYGWFLANGKAIQGAGGCLHGPAFADCSHGNRLVAPSMIVDGQTMAYQDVLKSKEYVGLLFDGGVPFPEHSLRYPDIELVPEQYRKYAGG